MKIKLFPPRKRLFLYLKIIAAIFIIKIPWTFYCEEDGASVLDGRSMPELLARRKYLIDQIVDGKLSPSHMPKILPAQFKGEWAIGTFSMASAALTNIAFRNESTREESKQIIAGLIKQTLGLEFREFDAKRWGEDPIESLGGDAGHIGFLGHLHWMISAYRILGGEPTFDALHRQITESFVRRYTKSPGFCLETYPGEIYIPDNVVVLASLAAYSRIHPGELPEVDDLLKRWVVHAREKLVHPSYGVLPFHLDSHCAPLGGPKGSGAGWNTFYLPFIDRQFADEQFASLKTTFLQTRIITGIREYPRDKFGVGDVDSGPVIFGFSPSGTGFAVAGAVHANDAELLSKFLFTGELVGSTIETSEGRRYLLAPLVGEAILLAMKTAVVWDGRYLPAPGLPR